MADEEYKLEFALETLNHLGRQLYRSFATVVSEAVSNSWDAGATEVRIQIDKKTESMTIEDNGKGMNGEDFRKKFLTIGYSRRADDSEIHGIQRPPHGRKGIGKLALLSVSKKLTIITLKRGGEVVGGTIDNGDLDDLIKERETDYSLKPLEQHEREHDFTGGSGTVLKFEEIEARFNSPEKIRTYMALAFSFVHGSKNPADQFDIYVNGEPVDRKIDLKELDGNTDILWTFDPNFDSIATFSSEFRDEEVEKFKLHDLNSFEIENERRVRIHGYIASVKKAGQLQVRGSGGRGEEPIKAGVHLYTNGRLRQSNILGILGSSSIVPSYLYGEIHVDALDSGNLSDKDIFTSSREGVLEDDDRFRAFKGQLYQVFNRLVADWSEHRKKERDKPKGGSQQTLKPRFQKVVKKFEQADEEDLGKVGSELISEFTNVSGRSHEEEQSARAKTILLCHSYKDKEYADFAFHLLLHFQIPAEEIVYSSARDTDEERAARFPIQNFMRDLKRFFNQHTHEEPTLVVVHSAKLKTWNPTIEVGASWMAGTGNRIIDVVENDKSERLEFPLTAEDIYAELEQKINDDGKKELTFRDISAASQWFRKLVNFCHRRKGRTEVSWDEDDFQRACDAVNEKLRGE